ncbi:HalOD1 output domain-containing protein [Halosimplex salinum]|uniref:HalOD1 output domain-containing protein n=1 Tax=Halosimplex salinum TaxID=1710538 RepID=UPI000F4A8A88|nr:HalOD1 output domain-containing protein [Halosimplex salinum]
MVQHATTATLSVIRAVADVEGTDPTDLPPLADAVDADALNKLLEHEGRDAELQITFRYCGYHVILTHDGHAVVDAPRPRPRPGVETEAVDPGLDSTDESLAD